MSLTPPTVQCKTLVCRSMCFQCKGQNALYHLFQCNMCLTSWSSLRNNAGYVDAPHSMTTQVSRYSKLFNLSIQSGQILAEWKQSLVVPIPKASNKAPPITIVQSHSYQFLSKVLECHMHMLITGHLTEHCMLFR